MNHADGNIIENRAFETLYEEADFDTAQSGTGA